MNDNYQRLLDLKIQIHLKDPDEELIEPEPLGAVTDAPLKNELTPVGNAGRASLLISKEAHEGTLFCLHYHNLRLELCQ